MSSCSNSDNICNKFNAFFQYITQHSLINPFSLSIFNKPILIKGIDYQLK